MALDVQRVLDSAATHLARDAQCAEVAQVAKVGSATLHTVMVDNRANGAPSSLKIYDDTAPDVGSDAPELIITAPPNTRLYIASTGAMYCATAVALAVVRTGGTGGQEGPANPVAVEIAFA